VNTVLIPALLATALLAAVPALAGETYLAMTGGLFAGPSTGAFGLHLKMHRENSGAGTGFGLELGYAGGLDQARRAKLLAFDPFPGPPTVTRVRVASLMATGKSFIENPGGGARLVISAGAGIQDRLTWRSSAGTIGPEHAGRFVMALGIGVEGTARLAPTLEFRATTLPVDRGSAGVIGVLFGVGFRP
jgi:hypothetical protein